MIECVICNKEFKNNLGGNLTIHLQNEHNLSMEDYHILTKLNGAEPKCQCGYCDERPNYHRGKFSKYSIGHEKYEWHINNYIKIHGQPKCKNHNCDNDVEFYRGKPREYCSHKCSEASQTNNWNQHKIITTVRNKYGVENVFQLNSVIEKSEQTMVNKHGVRHALQSNIIYNKMKVDNLQKYNTEFPQALPQARQKGRETIMRNYGVDNFSKTKEFRELASKNMCTYNDNIITNHKIRRYNTTTDLYYQSQYEYRFLQYCEKNNLLIYVNNSPTFKYLDKKFGKWHIPDFKFKNNIIIEIKSTYWLKRGGGWDVINAKKESVESCGYQYILLLDENYDNFFKVLVDNNFTIEKINSLVPLRGYAPTKLETKLDESHDRLLDVITEALETLLT